jgi:hypothetical protein
VNISECICIIKPRTYSRQNQSAGSAGWTARYFGIEPVLMRQRMSPQLPPGIMDWLRDGLEDLYGAMHLADDVHLKRAALEAHLTFAARGCFGGEGGI